MVYFSLISLFMGEYVLEFKAKILFLLCHVLALFRLEIIWVMIGLGDFDELMDFYGRF